MTNGPTTPAPMSTPVDTSNRAAVVTFMDAAWAALKLALLDGGRDLTEAEMTALRLLIGSSTVTVANKSGPGIGIGEDMGGGRTAGDKR